MHSIAELSLNDDESLVLCRCNGRSPSLSELPFCYTGDTWENVTLNEFIDCPQNLARNRQTRMLANLSLVNCYRFVFSLVNCYRFVFSLVNCYRFVLSFAYSNR